MAELPTAAEAREYTRTAKNIAATNEIIKIREFIQAACSKELYECEVIVNKNTSIIVEMLKEKRYTCLVDTITDDEPNSPYDRLTISWRRETIAKPRKKKGP